MKKKGISIFLILLLLSCTNLSKQVNEIVQTEQGKIKGVRNQDNKVIVFKGIPYAAPPIGELRWKAPQPHKKWDGILNCSEFGPAAMQADPQPFYMWTSEFIAPADKMSEDCLYLNIWTKTKSNDEKLPVIVFIHGGGFSSGSGAVPVYDGEAMAKTGVVFVTINYRVGIFGFFAHPGLTAESTNHASGNYGLLDQVAALRWVSKNIQSFGGDPENITIAGQSAGAFSVNYLVASPLAKGLFHKAIAESGAAVLPTNPLAGNSRLTDAEKQGSALAEKLGFTDIKGLRSVPAKELIQKKFFSGPVVDGYFLPKTVYEILKEGSQNDVPLLVGWNANEGNFGGPLLNLENYIQQAEKEYQDQANTFLKLFPAGTEEEAKHSQNLLGGLKTFGLQTFAWLNIQNKTGTAPVFMYYFKKQVPFGKGQQDFGAFHTSEVPYAYGNLNKSTVRPWEPIDYELEKLMTGYWAEFAKKGDPNFSGAPVWKPCKEPDYATMILGKGSQSGKIPFLPQLKFFLDFYSRNL
jgi:para-nitrobenzyl esterase